jgi:hypothetical protein
MRGRMTFSGWSWAERLSVQSRNNHRKFMMVVD